MISQQVQSRPHGTTLIWSQPGHRLPAYYNRRTPAAPGSQQRTAIKAVTGQVRETANNGNSSSVSHRSQEPVAEQQAAETPKKQFNWWVALLAQAVLLLSAHLYGSQQLSAPAFTDLNDCARVLSSSVVLVSQVQAVVPSSYLG